MLATHVVQQINLAVQLALLWISHDVDRVLWQQWKAPHCIYYQTKMHTASLGRAMCDFNSLVVHNVPQCLVFSLIVPGTSCDAGSTWLTTAAAMLLAHFRGVAWGCQ